MPRATTATIDCQAIKSNYLLANKVAPQSKNIAVIKANAYGHGIVQVATLLEPLVPAFAVAIFDEAAQLREAGITKPILVLQGANNTEELQYAVSHSIWTVIANAQQANLLLETPLTTPIHLWLKLNTGMNRLGLDETQMLKTLASLKSCPWVDSTITLCSHFACASDINNPRTELQLHQLQKMVSSICSQTNTQTNIATSIANSAALLGYDKSRLTWNRPGIMLYGLSPFDEPNPYDESLVPAMTFNASVIDIHQVNKGDTAGYGEHWIATKETTLATIGVGYADGYPRHAPNGTPLLIAGQKAALAGRVSMDMITADISQCHSIKVGDTVELWGKTLNANEVAKYSGTIVYDLVTAVSQRVSRIYS